MKQLDLMTNGAAPPARGDISQDDINAVLWRACDTFRGSVDPSEYKNYILVMLFLKYISDVWHDHHQQYRSQLGEDELRIQRRLSRERFVLPTGCDFESLYELRRADDIGERINIALDAIEEANREKLVKFYPVRRLGQAGDVAPMVALLVSPKSGWITGQTLSISGGFSMA